MGDKDRMVSMTQRDKQTDTRQTDRDRETPPTHTHTPCHPHTLSLSVIFLFVLRIGRTKTVDFYSGICWFLTGKVPAITGYHEP